MIDYNNSEIKFALQAVRLAAQVVRQVQANLVSPTLNKGDSSPVTVADYTSQAIIGYLLSQTFPDDPLVAEEDSAILRLPESHSVSEAVNEFVSEVIHETTADKVWDWIDRGKAEPGRRFWTLDPIDGTKGFLRGEQYAVALGLIVDGQVKVGVLGCPNLTDSFRPDVDGPGSLVAAARSQGTWITPLDAPGEFDRLQVSQRANPAQARLFRSFESGHTNVSQIDEFVEVMGIQAEPVRMDSQAKYAVLAAGKGDLLLRLISVSKPDYREKIWDQAAGSIIIEEAGGQITDVCGRPLDFTHGRTLARNRGICASNAQLHRAALRALEQIGA
jgi:3'(2'), 5'-bisphosphate nucleotidase